MTRPTVRWLIGLLVSVVLVVAISALISLAPSHPSSGFLLIYMLAVIPVAILWDTALTAVTAVLSAAASAYLFLPPIHSFGVAKEGDAVSVGIFLLTAIVLGELAARLRRTTQSRAELKASRARLVATADQNRRQLERDLDHAAQQRLVSLALRLRHIQRAVPADLPDLRNEIERSAEEINQVLDEVCNISRGIRPPILSNGGLGWALHSLARRSQVPVALDIRTERRFPEPVEVAAYFVVSEALTNITKHAEGASAHVVIEERDQTLHLLVRDDGPGGADPSHGSGLIGLRDRVESLGGKYDISSPPDRGTSIKVSLPTGTRG